MSINEIPTEDIINEVKLRTDMAKMSFNATLVKFGLHNIFRRFMFKKEDYYFMNIEKEKEENERIKKEMIDSECKGLNNSYSFNSDEQTYAGSILDNNYSQLENENDLLK